MLDRYGCGCWCLLNSGDELLVYPHSNKISLKGLCAQLGTVGAQALSCQMLDMTPTDVHCEQDYRMGESPLAVYSRFDPRFQRVETVASDPVTGRVFSASLAVGVEKPNTAEPYLFRSKEHFGIYPCRSKVALLKYRKGLGMAADLRAIEGARLSKIEGAVLRFRRCRPGKGPAEASDNMQQALSASPFPALEMTDPRATDDPGRSCCIQFQDTSQLARLGLLRSSVGLDRYLQQCEDGKPLTEQLEHFPIG
jgi:hypothetical protein